jgi:hypothetical protein
MPCRVDGRRSQCSCLVPSSVCLCARAIILGWPMGPRSGEWTRFLLRLYDVLVVLLLTDEALLLLFSSQTAHEP